MWGLCEVVAVPADMAVLSDAQREPWCPTEGRGAEGHKWGSGGAHYSYSWRAISVTFHSQEQSLQCHCPIMGSFLMLPNMEIVSCSKV